MSPEWETNRSSRFEKLTAAHKLSTSHSLSSYRAGNFFSYFTPLVTDSTLIFKILAFFPSQSTPLLKRALVVALPVLIKAPRLGVIAAYLNQGRVALNGPGGFEAAVTVAGDSVFLRVELVLQLVDNLYSAGFFLITVYQFRSRHVRQTGSHTHSFRQLSSSGSAVVNSLTWLLESAIFTFTIPVILQVTQLALLYSGNGGITYTSVFVSNVYLSIVFGECPEMRRRNNSLLSKFVTDFAHFT